jgi:hypothetical protein
MFEMSVVAARFWADADTGGARADVFVVQRDLWMLSTSSNSKYTFSTNMCLTWLHCVFRIVLDERAPLLRMESSF